MARCSAKNRRCAGGDEWCIGGTLKLEPGAALEVQEGAEVKGLDLGATHWDDLEGKPFYRESDELYRGYPEYAWGYATLPFVLREGINYSVGYIDEDGLRHAYAALTAEKNNYGVIAITKQGVFRLETTENGETYLYPDGEVFVEGYPETSENGHAYTSKYEVIIRFTDSNDAGVIPLPSEYLPSHTHMWGDIENPPFYKKLTLLESQADAEFTDAYGADSITQAFLVNKGYTLESGDLIINFDGVEYNCHRIGGSYSIMDDTNRSTVSFWGNGSYIPDNFYSLYSFDTKDAFADTGEPFAIAIFNNTSGYVSEGIVYAAASAMGNTHSFSISNTDVKTIEDVCIPTTIPRTPTAAVGQVVRVKAVDDNGVPTEWEAADMGGGVNKLYISQERTYIYKTFENYTPENPITKSELVELLNKGNSMFIDADSSSADYDFVRFPSYIDAGDDYVTVYFQTGNFTVYTIEYEAPITG